MSHALKRKLTGYMSETEYLDTEKHIDIRREYYAGEAFAMSGAHRHHNILAGNMFGEIRAHLKGKPCTPFMSDMRVKSKHNYFYPDVMVDCASHADYYTETPVLIVEVLSPSTRKWDMTLKQKMYHDIDSLQEYVLIEQHIAQIEIQRRSNHWQAERFFLGDMFTLHSIGLSLSVADLYARVEIADVSDWLAEQAALVLQAESPQTER